MITKIWISLIVSAGLGIVFCSEPDVLLQADFDDTICAESRDGDGAALLTAGLTDKSGGRNGTSGLNVTNGITETEKGTEVLYSPVIYKAEKNFSSEEGCLDFYVKFCGIPKDGRDFLLPLAGISDWKILPGAEWALEGCNHYSFVALERKKEELRFVFSEYRYRQKSTLDKKGVKHDLSGFASPDHEKFILRSQPLNWKDGEWHRITAVWCTKGKLRRLYLDGKREAEGVCIFPNPLFTPGALQIVAGGVVRSQQPLFRYVIDDFRILDGDFFIKK